MLAHVLVMLGLAALLALYVAACIGVSPRAVIPHGDAAQKFLDTEIVGRSCAASSALQRTVMMAVSLNTQFGAK
jgi:hypothetical protein